MPPRCRVKEVHYTDFVHREIHTRNDWLFGYEERMMGKYKNICKESGWYENNTDLFQMFCILRHPVCIVLLNPTYPGNIVWLYG